MNVTDINKCHYCKDDIDYTEHVFVDCTVARILWTHVENKLFTLVGIILKLGVIDVLFGVKDKKLNRRVKNLVNQSFHIILIGKTTAFFGGNTDMNRANYCIVKKTQSAAPVHLVLEQNINLRMV